MKVFILYEENYGDIATECGNALIIGVYDSYDKARARVDELIKKDKENEWVLDEQNNSRELVRMFFRNQENWGDYFEYIIEEKEVE